MLRIFEPMVAGISFVFILLLTPPAIGQQAPKPAQILEAKKVFISNASGESYEFFFSDPEQPYDQFYAAVKASGRYEPVSSPADADLVFEIQFVPPRDSQQAQVKLVILDSKTRITLWTINEKIPIATRQSTGRKNFAIAISTLTQDLARLAAPVTTAGSAPVN